MAFVVQIEYIVVRVCTALGKNRCTVDNIELYKINFARR
jgi:hypothetical protein